MKNLSPRRKIYKFEDIVNEHYETTFIVTANAPSGSGKSTFCRSFANVGGYSTSPERFALYNLCIKHPDLCRKLTGIDPVGWDLNDYVWINFLKTEQVYMNLIEERSKIVEEEFCELLQDLFYCQNQLQIVHPENCSQTSFETADIYGRRNAKLSSIIIDFSPAYVFLLDAAHFTVDISRPREQRKNAVVEREIERYNGNRLEKRLFLEDRFDIYNAVEESLLRSMPEGDFSVFNDGDMVKIENKAREIYNLTMNHSGY